MIHQRIAVLFKEIFLGLVQRFRGLVVDALVYPLFGMLRCNAFGGRFLLAGFFPGDAFDDFPSGLDVVNAGLRDGVRYGRAGKDSVFVDPNSFARPDAGRAVGKYAHRAVRADGYAVGGGEQQRVDYALVVVGNQFRGGVAHGMACSGNRRAHDTVANGGVVVDRIADSGLDKLRRGFPVQVRLVEPPLDGLDQFRRLLSSLQPTQ